MSKVLKIVQLKSCCAMDCVVCLIYLKFAYFWMIKLSDLLSEFLRWWSRFQVAWNEHGWRFIWAFKNYEIACLELISTTYEAEEMRFCCCVIAELESISTTYEVEEIRFCMMDQICTRYTMFLRHCKTFYTSIRILN